MSEQTQTQQALDLIKQGLASLQTNDWATRIALCNAVSVIEQELAMVAVPAPVEVAAE